MARPPTFLWHALILPLVPVATLHAPAARAVEPGAAKILVSKIVVAADYGRSYVAYGVATAVECQSACARLLRSVDGGVAWPAAPARGWEGGSVVSTPAGIGELLVAATPTAVGTLVARGESFERASDGGGFLSAAPVAGGVEAAVASGGAVTTIRLPGGRPTRHQAPALGNNVSVLLASGYPNARGVAPAVLAAGSDPVTGMPAVARCDASFACDAPVVVPNDRKDVARVFASPRVDRDGVVVALPTSGSLSVSTDGARTFSRATVRPLVPGDVTVAVQDVAFSPDFDLAARRGRAYAAVVAVHAEPDETRTVLGGVYASTDLVTWTALGGPSRLDRGATAVAAAPDGRVFAAYLDVKDGGGILCAAPGRSWGTCSSYATAGRGTPKAGTTPASSDPRASATASAVATAGSAPRASAAAHGGTAARTPSGVESTGRTRPTNPVLPLGLGLAGAATVAGAAVVVRKRRA